MRGLREEVSRACRRELRHTLPQRPFHPRFDGQNVLLLHEAEVLRNGTRLHRSECLARVGHGHQWQVFVACFLQPQRGVGAHQLATRDRHLVFPGERHEQDVAQKPRVLGLTNARSAGTLGSFHAQPFGKGAGGGMRLGHGAQKFLIVAGYTRAQRLEYDGLFFEYAHGAHPQIVRRTAGEVYASLFQQWRYRAQRRRKARRFLARERANGVQHGARPDAILPEANDPVDGGTFFRRRIALFGAHRGVVGRIARPGLQHRQVKLHPVHFGAHQMVIHLFGDRPPTGVDGLESLLQQPQSRAASHIRSRRVVGNAVHARRFFERAPFGKQRQECWVRARCGLLCTKSTRRRARQQGTHEERADSAQASARAPRGDGTYDHDTASAPGNAATT